VGPGVRSDRLRVPPAPLAQRPAQNVTDFRSPKPVALCYTGADRKVSSKFV